MFYVCAQAQDSASVWFYQWISNVSGLSGTSTCMFITSIVPDFGQVLELELVIWGWFSLGLTRIQLGWWYSIYSNSMAWGMPTCIASKVQLH